MDIYIYIYNYIYIWKVPPRWVPEIAIDTMKMHLIKRFTAILEKTSTWSCSRQTIGDSPDKIIDVPIDRPQKVVYDWAKLF